MSRHILVTDGDQRAALALVRSLGAAGHRVHVVSPVNRSLAGASRYAAVEQRVRDPLRDPAGFVDHVSELAAAWKIDLLLPVAEPSLLAILSSRERFGDICIPVPPLEAFRRVTDKARVLEAAREVGIAVPEQWTLHTRDDLEKVAPPPDLFPLVLKPSRSVGEGHGGRVKLGVSYAADPERLSASVAAMEDAAFPLLLQRRVIGPGIGIFLLLWEGRTVAAFAHRRLREKPPAGGVSVYCESVAADPSLVDRSRALLQRVGWWGVAMVEYKLDSATGTPYLMEINGRFWGSLQLAVDAGVDFHALLVDAASGHVPAPAVNYRTGIRSRWWWGDVDHLLIRMRHSPEALALPPDAPSRWGSIRRFLAPGLQNDRSDVFRLSDPGPFLRESLDRFLPAPGHSPARAALTDAPIDGRDSVISGQASP